MSLWLVVPVKSVRDGKSRLAHVMDSAQRCALVESLLVRTLGQAALFPGLQHTLVVSACDETRSKASAVGARVLTERAPMGLNNALRQAQLALRGLGAARMLMVSCDLPLLCAEDLQALTDAASGDTIAIAPDRARQGTNGLCLQSSQVFDFSFGPNSFQRHLHCAQQVKISSTIVERIGLAFDVDTPDDLTELEMLERRQTHPWHAVEGQ